MDAEAIRELFDPVIRVSLRRMFGGHGVYADGQMFAIEADGLIWMKCDAATQPAFEARGLRPFTYAKNGKPYAMSYRELPDSAFDDAEELRGWVRLAREAAARAAAARAPSRRR
jgi:DNA transformation protein